MTEHSTLQSAQIAANNDQYKSAICRLSQNTPVAINTKEIVEILEGLYPPKHKIKRQYETKIKYKSKHIKSDISIETFINTISKKPKARAAGPFGDISDVLRSMVTYTENKNSSNPYAKSTYSIRENTQQRHAKLHKKTIQQLLRIWPS